MSARLGCGGMARLLAAAALGLQAVDLAAAQECGRVYSLDQLAHMSRCQLEHLYRNSGPGCVPSGFTPGRPIYCPDECLSGLRSRATGCVWRGKIFADDCTLVNQWCGFKAIKARVYDGPSWLDGQPSIIMDYCGTSHVWADVRDEIREVSPGVYLGLMYQRRCPEPKFKMFFALETLPQGCPLAGAKAGSQGDGPSSCQTSPAIGSP